MSNKELYSEFCLNQADMPLFMQLWWMDSVCAGKQWEVLLWDENVEDVSGEGVEVSGIAAAMPYLYRKRLWMRYILMPQQTQLGGVWVREDKRQDAEFLQKLADRVTKKLAEMRLSYYYQQYPIGSPLPELMKERGFKVKERITYRINDLSNLDAVLDSFSKNKKRQLQKALTMSADTEMDAEDFYRYHDSCLKEQNKKITYTREFFMVLYKKASRLGQCKILRIKTIDGETAAAAFLVWDKQTMYYLIPCYSQSQKDSGAGALLVWEALKIARQQGLQFDFEGSMIRGVANHYKQFGSTANKYYSVHKYYRPLFAIALLFNKIRN